MGQKGISLYAHGQADNSNPCTISFSKIAELIHSFFGLYQDKDHLKRMTGQIPLRRDAIILLLHQADTKISASVSQMRKEGEK
jgi:hypothetical protein